MNTRLIAWASLVLLAAGCAEAESPRGPASPPRPGQPLEKPPTAAVSVTLATTTSTQDSGLLDVLLPLFEEQTGIPVKVVAVGSGQALELGRRGDADLVLAHSPAAEEAFMAEGHGSFRRRVMHNDFVLVGPGSDSAGVDGEASVAAAFSRISRESARFISRGDDSGTHRKEQEIWKKAGIEPRGDWYVEAGAGMGQVLRMAYELEGYTLADRGTFLAHRKQHDLTIVSQGDPLLANPYSVLLVNARKHPHVRQAEAQQLADFFLAPAAQELIAGFGVERFGQPLFFPDGQRPTSESPAAEPAPATERPLP